MGRWFVFDLSVDCCESEAADELRNRRWASRASRFGLYRISGFFYRKSWCVSVDLLVMCVIESMAASGCSSGSDSCSCR